MLGIADAILKGTRLPRLKAKTAIRDFILIPNFNDPLSITTGKVPPSTSFYCSRTFNSIFTLISWRASNKRSRCYIQRNKTTKTKS